MAVDTPTSNISVSPTANEFFEIKDPKYIDNLIIILKKLRRYRWI